MLLTALLLALAAGRPASGDSIPKTSAKPAAHSHVCASVERTGTFRITTTKHGGTAAGVGMVLLENIGGCLEATFVTDNAGPAIIDGLSTEGDTLRGTMRTTNGTAELMLRFNQAGVDGSIVQGANEWKVEGRKTS